MIATNIINRQARQEGGVGGVSYPGPCDVWGDLLSPRNRVVKRSSDLRTLNFMFKFVFVFQPFDIRIQASLIIHRRFCLESGALSGALCDDFFVLCRLSIPATPATCLLTPPLPSLHTATVFNYSPLYTDASYQSDKSWWPRHRADINRRQ